LDGVVVESKAGAVGEAVFHQTFVGIQQVDEDIGED
jgi:hypothetical protein